MPNDGAAHAALARNILSLHSYLMYLMLLNGLCMLGNYALCLGSQVNATKTIQNISFENLLFQSDSHFALPARPTLHVKSASLLSVVFARLLICLKFALRKMLHQLHCLIQSRMNSACFCHLCLCFNGIRFMFVDFMFICSVYYRCNCFRRIDGYP